MKTVVYSFRLNRSLEQSYENARADKLISSKNINVNLVRTFYLCLQEGLLGITETEEYLKRRIEDLEKRKENKTTPISPDINNIQDNQSTNSLVVEVPKNTESDADWFNLAGNNESQSDI